MKRRQPGKRGQHNLRPPARRHSGETGVDVLRNRENAASGDRSVGRDDGGRPPGDGYRVRQPRRSFRFGGMQNGLKSLGVLTGIANEETIRKAEGELAPLLYTDSLTDVKDILVFGEDLTNEDEEKQALEELEKLKEQRREMRRKQREERRKRKENLEKEIEEGKKLIEEEFERMEKENKQNEGKDTQN